MRLQVMISRAYPCNDKPTVLKNYDSFDQTSDGLLTGYKCHSNYLKHQMKKKTYLIVQVTWFLKDKK